MNRDDVRLIVEKALHRMARAAGFDLKPIINVPVQPIDILGLTIRELIGQQKEVFFLQIGAHDGKSHDPISPYVRKYRWRGILVEPNPVVFKQLQENYKDHPELILENVAIDSKEGTLTLHCFEGATADSHASMLTSTRKHYLQLNSDGARGKLVSIQVPAVTVSSLLKKHGVERVDLLQIDTEGHDFTILKTIDFSTVRPKIVHFENNFMNKRQKEQCLKIFAQNGYASLDLGIDTLAYRQSADADFEDRIALSRVTTT